MTKIRFALVLAISLILTPSWQAQQPWQDACIQRCMTQTAPADPEMQRQEIISLEKEAARAIQLGSGTFFHRVYSDDFTGALSHGQLVDKDQWIAAVESPNVKRESFIVSDIKVRIFQETAVATCLWSTRFTVKGQHLSTQFRAIHVYVNTPRGWHVVSGHTTNLPPDVQQVL
jgi:hypothetical protein